MQPNRNIRYRAAMLCGAALVAFTTSAMAAEDAPPTEAAPAVADEVGTIVVTGTRLRAVAPIGSALIGVTRDQVTASTAISTTQLIQEVPQVLNLGVTDASRVSSGGEANTAFANSINIRGLGAFSTLTLIDGHRSVPQGSTGFAIDPSSIPTVALQRLEIVADGASAIYGSDAVAGVANMILRRNVEDFEFQWRQGDGKNYTERQFSAIGGHKWNSGQFTLSAEKVYRDNVNSSDRSFFSADLRPRGGSDYRVNFCNPGNIVANNVSYAIPTGGVTAANRGALVAGTANRCDAQKGQDLLPQQQRETALFTFNQRINDRISINADGFFTKRDYRALLAFTSSTLAVPSSNAFFVAPPGLSPTSESVQYSFESVYPQPLAFGTTKTGQIHFGTEVKLSSDWRLTSDVTIGRNKEFRDNGPQPDTARLTTALASNNPATAFNPFGQTNPAVIADILANISYTKGFTKFDDYQLQLDGGLFRLPGGQIRVATGWEQQNLEVHPQTIDGPANAQRNRQKIRQRTVNSGFVEMLVPLVGEANARAGIRRLDLNLAGRYDHYDDVGETWNPKVGLNWEPTEGLVLHGSYGTSFRAPSMSQLYGTGGGRLALFVQNYSDPTCNCIRQGVATSGESPGLQPEEARTYSLGADWRPRGVSGLSFSVNFFDVKYTKQVAAYIADLTLLTRESQFAGTGVITRNPDPAFIAGIVAQSESLRGVIPTPLTLFINGNALNTGNTKARGLDFQASYAFSAGDWGDLAFNLSGSYFLDFKQSLGPRSQYNDLLNTIFYPLRFKSRASVRWMKGPFELGAAASYVNAYTNNTVTPTQKVKAYTPVDLRASYNFGDVAFAKQIKLSVDARNAFDIKPPFANVAQSPNGGGGFDPTAADPTGRVISAMLNARF